MVAARPPSLDELVAQLNVIPEGKKGEITDGERNHARMPYPRLRLPRKTTMPLHYALLACPMALFIAGCQPPQQPPARTASADAPSQLDAPGTNKFADAIRVCVRAYLHSFNLNEKSLTPGLTIPFAYTGPSDGGSWVASVGGLQATGKLGAQGHQVYEFHHINVGADGVGKSAGHEFLEISSEP